MWIYPFKVEGVVTPSSQKHKKKMEIVQSISAPFRKPFQRLSDTDRYRDNLGWWVLNPLRKRLEIFYALYATSPITNSNNVDKQCKCRANAELIPSDKTCTPRRGFLY